MTSKRDQILGGIGFGLLVLGIAVSLISSFTSFNISGNWIGILLLAISIGLIALIKEKEDLKKIPVVFLPGVIGIALVLSATIIHGDNKSWELIILSILTPLILLLNKND